MPDIQKHSWPIILTRMIKDQIQKFFDAKPKSLPCYVTNVNKQIVTVKFDLLASDQNYNEIQIPVATSQYIQCPIQIGDKGDAIGVDATLKNVSGLGYGTADLNNVGNLTSLFYQPISNINWPAEDLTKVVIQGPDGVQLKTIDKTVTFTLSSTGIVLQIGTSLVTVSENNVTIKTDTITLDTPTVNVTGDVNVTGKASIGGIDFASHTHNVPGVSSGSSTVVSNGPNS